ncbi:hypothetical protein ABZ746_08705 [Streptomyces sp. NPDC020096]
MRKILHLAIAFVAFLVASVGLVLPAVAAGDYGEKYFEIGDQFFQATDSNGHFTAQVSYVSGGRPFRDNPVAFSFVISPYLRSIATGTMQCRAWQSKNGALTGASDYHSIPPGYLWHWTFPENPMGPHMEASGSCVFPVNAGGRTGIANVRFLFRYVVDNGGGDAVSHRNAVSSDTSALVSSASIP